MTHPILGLHHVTATVNDAQADLDFCLDLLGLRLVKKTVNFDNHDVYHFYYGTERGLPGTIWTTFPYKGHGVRVGTHGAGQVTVTSFSVPASSLDFWRERLTGLGATVEDRPAVFGEESLRVRDSSARWPLRSQPPNLWCTEVTAPSAFNSKSTRTLTSRAKNCRSEEGASATGLLPSTLPTR